LERLSVRLDRVRALRLPECLAAVCAGLAQARGACAAPVTEPSAPRARTPVAAESEAAPWLLGGTLGLGRGLRFNNPYRLAAPLGETAESVSLSATYLDLGVQLLGPALPGIDQGASLDALFALDGIAQFGLTPSYVVQFALAEQFFLHGRVAVPLVITPDTTLGLEAAVGPRFDLAWGLGLTAELVGSVFFGAATEQRSVTTIPMLSFQIGVCFTRPVLL
jgi:hypothetical protein